MPLSSTGREPAPDRRGQPGDPCIVVIFGAAGDLTRRKLIPALYNLARGRLLAPNFAVVGLAREAIGTEQFRQRLAQKFQGYATGPVDPELRDALLRRVYYQQGDFMDAAAYGRLK
ncbi:MAG: glucose-6-phosphate dehydrogenase, partial [Proteobacteria bacterium]|nr:glucose-6-phosphate dehydrogenase [Pseudomonadota bacterium]